MIDILQDELITILKRLLYIESNPLREIRDLILISYSFGFEIKAMKGLRIDLILVSWPARDPKRGNGVCG